MKQYVEDPPLQLGKAMKPILPIILMLTLSFTAYPQTIIPTGTISGTWTIAGSPYLIEGMTWISDGTTLTIEPGVVVEFQDSFTMYVQGQILAIGTELDSIIFTAADTSIGFNSIRFLDTPMGNDTSRFSYCRFEWGRVHGLWPENSGGAIGVTNYNKIVIDHCIFENNYALIENEGFPSGGAIALWTSSPVIRNSKFIHNVSIAGGAIICYIESHPVIHNNIFKNNMATFYGGAILCNITSSPHIDHNLFYHNTAGWDGGAIELWDDCSPKIINNTIANNTAHNVGGGIDMIAECNPSIKNTILWGNIADTSGNQIYIFDETCLPNFYYSDIEGGEDEFGGVPFLGEYENNIDEDPLFVDEEYGDYSLTEDSPCIDEGDPAMFDPDGTIVDIGAYYYDQLQSGLHDWNADRESPALEVYPIPSRGISDIRFMISDIRFVKLDVYDVRGTKIKPLKNDELQPGEYTVRFDASELPAGIYLVRMQVGDKVETVKLLVMR